MTTDFRALCARMADELDYYRQLLMDDRHEIHALANEARAALAEPQPEPPTKAELKQLFDDQSGYINDEQVMWWSDFHAAARAVLTRWSSDGPAVQSREPASVATEPSNEDLHNLWLELYAFQEGVTSGDVAEIARAVLARWGS